MFRFGGRRMDYAPLSDEDALLFRAVSSREVLKDKGALLNVDGDVAKYDAYGATFAVQTLRYFLSHSWKNEAWLKRYGLHYVLFLQHAFLLSFVVGGIVVTLEWYAAVPSCLPQYVGFLDGKSNMFIRESYNWVPGMLTFPLVFYAGPYLFPSATCFLDRCCLDQVNIDRKEKGIALISEFLRRSDQMILFWQREYFQRLWCSFEAATFIKFNGIQNVVFVPLSLPLFTLALALYHGVASIIYSLVAPVAMAPWIVHMEADKLLSPPREIAYLAVKLLTLFAPMYAIPSHYLWKFTCMHVEDTRELFHQIENYSIRDCQCTEEKDRQYVEKEVAKAFGSLDEFDRYIRVEMKAHIREVVQEDVLAPYGSVFAGCFAHVHLCASWFPLQYEPGHPPLPILTKLAASVMLVACTDAIALWFIAKGAQATVGSGSPFVQGNGWWLGPLLVTASYTVASGSVIMIMQPFVPNAVRFGLLSAEVLFVAWAYGLAGAAREMCASLCRGSSRGPARTGGSTSYFPLVTPDHIDGGLEAGKKVAP